MASNGKYFSLGWYRSQNRQKASLATWIVEWTIHLSNFQPMCQVIVPAHWTVMILHWSSVQFWATCAIKIKSQSPAEWDICRNSNRVKSTFCVQLPEEWMDSYPSWRCTEKRQKVEKGVLSAHKSFSQWEYFSTERHYREIMPSLSLVISKTWLGHSIGKPSKFPNFCYGMLGIHMDDNKVSLPTQSIL